MVDRRDSRRRGNQQDGNEALKTEGIDVIWARTGERVWPLDDHRRSRTDRRTLRERLEIPRDQDDDELSPLLTPPPVATATTRTPAPPSNEPAPPRGSLTMVADRVADDDGRSVLLTDTTDPELARQAAESLVDELGARDIPSAHLHVGPADHGEELFAGAMEEVDTFVETFSDEEHRPALATGAIEPSTVSDAIDHLLGGVDRVILTGTGMGLDPRQARLAKLAEAIVVRDDSNVFDDRDVPELLDEARPVLAILQGAPTPTEPPQTRRKLPATALVGVAAAIAAVVIGGLIYLAVTSDDTDVADPPATTAPETATPRPTTVATAPSTATTPPSTVTAPDTTVGGGIVIGVAPELLAAPTLTLRGDSVSVAGAVRSEAKAERIRAAAAVLANGAEVQDELLVDPLAARWTIVRIDVPMTGLRDGEQLSPAGQRWAEAIGEVIRSSRARVLLTGGTNEQGPQPMQQLLDQDLRARGFEPVIVRAVGPGSPAVVLGSEVDSPDL